MENNMKDYMVAHKFKTEELRDQYFEMTTVTLKGN